ncbi:ATP-binding protein [Streptomyces sp. SB3404]|uniref:ATP-binding protein n=2 Tax=Streptomyces boncukensis TaxID=2711219 RepID=A0A6G4WTF4_9ACTN|nr:ATP-binding protein [Streptomyces boncukensis]NGO67920.1 ATP-binding protein [Streptomyces boncukensis]
MRRAARIYLDVWQLVHLAPPVTLALTELLTNVHRHVPDRWCVSTVTRTLDGVRIEVYDRSPALPVAMPRAEPLLESGRGLVMVELVTDKWDVITHREGKTVWCELLDRRNP